MTPRYAVFGQPIAHSQSPRIHTAFGKEQGIAVDYRAIEASPEAFVETLERFAAEGGRGANVTLPHKQAAFAVCANVSQRAQRAGSVNTLLRQDDGQWYGDSTDGIGLVRDLSQRQGLDLRGRRVLLLGAGGAARSVAPALLDAGIGEMVIANRTASRADALVDIIGQPQRVTSAYWHSLHEQGNFELIINATSASRSEPAQFHLPLSLVDSLTAAVDLNYGEAAIAFLAWARTAPCRYCFDGLGMLVEQAAESFYLWHGVYPQTDAIYAELRAHALSLVMAD